ncbi:hypothetical protein L218DRAFT_1080635 [Marasmius fiardii PR-910]|nr:hypothetical protein L218DRAFT_1080635 [Marasmius fiardii PR-910]
MEIAKQQMEDHLKRRPSVFAVHQKVPIELWETIFRLACSACSTDGYSLAIDCDDAGERTTVAMFPILLSHVCSRWRSIVTKCPKLWSSISIRVFEIPEATQALLETFLAKSAGSPLRLRIWAMMEDMTAPDLPEPVQTAWDILTRHFSQCEELSIDVQQRFLAASSTIQDFDFVFPYLKALSYDLGPDPDALLLDLHDEQFWQAIFRAPKLTEVRVDGLHPDRLRFPYPQLTTLSMTLETLEHSVKELLEALKLSCNLRSLTLSGFDNDYDDEAPVDTSNPYHVEMPSLRELYVRPDRLDAPIRLDNPNLILLLSSLIMPVLSDLELSCAAPDVQNMEWPSSLRSMLQHSSNTLRTFSLYIDPSTKPATWEPLSALLEATPRLTRFKWGGYGLPSSESMAFPSDYVPRLFSDLTYVVNNPNNTLLPDLEHVSISDIPLTSDVLNKGLVLASSRGHNRRSEGDHGVRPLKEIRIAYDTRISPEPPELGMLDKLEEDGVVLIFAKSWAWT